MPGVVINGSVEGAMRLTEPVRFSTASDPGVAVAICRELQPESIRNASTAQMPLPTDSILVLVIFCCLRVAAPAAGKR